jgi:hypothetical protein
MSLTTQHHPDQLDMIDYINTQENNMPLNQATPPTPSTPTISSSSMLVELSISTWTGRKKDKRASADVTSQNYAAAGVAAVNKKLLGDCAELSAVQKFTANLRNAHYSMTMPWSDTGLRLLPTAQYFKYNQQMTALQSEYERLVQNFLDAYDWEISQAQAKLGDLFLRDDYPTLDNLRGKFRFGLTYIPLADAGDFRIDIANDAAEELRTHYETYYSNQLSNAMNDVWKRTYDALSRMSERLDYADHEQKKVFRDSLVDNVGEMVELLRVCNVGNDVQMTAMAANLEDTLRGVTPEALREDEYLRRETKRAVDEAIKALPSLDI